MVTALLALTAAPIDAARIFDECVAAHQELAKATIGLHSVSKVRETRVTDYEIRYIRPDRLVMRVRDPAIGLQAESDRTFALIGGKLVGYDASAHERLSRNAPVKASLAEKLSAFTELDQPVQALLDSASMRAFLNQFRTLSKWTVSFSGGKTVVSRATTGNRWSKTVFEFGLKSSLLTRIVLSQSSGTLEWNVTYKTPPRSLSFSPPPDALVVKSFTAREPFPRGVEPEARAVADASVRAYNRLRHGYWTLQEGGAESRIWISGYRARESRKDMNWVYDGTYLSVDLPRKKAFYRGKKAPGVVLATLRKLGIDPSPTIWQYLSRRNPMLALLAPDVKARVAGTVTVDGAPCKVLEISRPGMRMNVVVRQKDGLWARYYWEMRDGSGNVVSQTDRAIRYLSVGSPLDADVFHITASKGAGTKRLP